MTDIDQSTFVAVFAAPFTAFYADEAVVGALLSFDDSV